MASKKKPRQVKHPNPRKSVRSRELGFQEKMVRSGEFVLHKSGPVSLPIVSRMDQPMRWSRKKKDVLGEWSWGQARQWTSQVWREKMHPLLKMYQGRLWKEVEAEPGPKGRKNKAYPVGSICDEAQKRLIEINLEEMDEVFRFRTGSGERIYGSRIQNWFLLLWWDGVHKICPSKKA